MADDKRIKIKIEIEENSHRNSIRLIQSINSELKKLAETATQAGAALSKTMGVSGNPFGVSFGNQGGNNAVGGAKTQAYNPGGAQSNSLSTTLTGLKNLYQGVGQVGAQAFQGLTQAVSRSISSQVTNINKLAKALGGLAAGYGAVANQAARAVQNLGTAPTLLAVPGGGGPGPGVTPGGGGGGGPRPGAGGGGPWSPGKMFSPGGVGGMLGQISGALGLPLSFSGPAAAIGSAMAVYNYGAGAYKENRLANLEAYTQGPLWAQERAGNVSDIYAGYSRAIEGGDFAMAGARKRVRTDPRFSNIYNTKARTEDIAKSTGYTPITIPDLARRGKGDVGQLVSQGLNDPKWALANAALGFMSPGLLTGGGVGSTSAVPFGNSSKIDIDYKKRMLGMPAAIAGDENKAVEGVLKEDPRMTDAVRRMTGESGNRVSMGRMGFYTPGIDKRTGLDSMDMLKAQLTAGGWSMGEYMGARRGMAGQGFGLRGLGGMTMRMGAGGFQGAERLAGLGAQWGGGMAGAARGFLGNLQGQIGTGGLDITGGSQLFGGVAERMAGSGQFGMDGGGGGVLGGIGAAAYTGTSGGDMFMSQAMMKGLGAYSEMTTGSIDPLQMAMNVSSANAAMGGKSWSLKRAVMDLAPEKLIDIARGGPLPENIRALGGSATDVMSYASAQGKGLFARALRHDIQGTDASKALERFTAAGGDMAGYVRSSLGGRSFKSRAEKMAAVRASVATLGAAYGGADQQKVMGLMMAQLARDKEFLPAVTGAKGARAAGLGSRDKKIHKAKGDIETRKAGANRDAADTGRFDYDVGAAVEEYDKGYGGAAGGYDAAIKDDVANIDSALKEFLAAISSATAILRGHPPKRAIAPSGHR